MALKKKRPTFDLADTYYDELARLARDMERAFAERPSWDVFTRSLEPLHDIAVRPDEVIMTVDLPFAEPKNVHVKPVGTSGLEISAKMRKKVTFEDLGIVHHQGEFQTFRCQTLMPVPVNLKKLKYDIKRGILSVHVPRKLNMQRAKPRR